MKKDNKESMEKVKELHKELEELKEEVKEFKEEIEECKEERKECEEEKVSQEKELEEWRKKAEEYYDQLLRLKAEFENYRKRIEKEKVELIEWARYDFILSILPLFEMMRMAQSHITEANSDLESIKTGLAMIFSEFDKVFKNAGLSEIDLLGKPYDPMSCEIVGVVDGNDEDDGKVVEIVQPGYLLKDRVLKPAKVRIARKKTDSDKKNDTEDENKNKEKNL